MLLYSKNKIYPKKAYKAINKLYKAPYDDYFSPTLHLKELTGVWVGFEWDLLGFQKNDLQWVIRALSRMARENDKDAEDQLYLLFHNIVTKNEINYNFEINIQNCFDMLMGLVSDLNLADIMFYMHQDDNVNYYEDKTDVLAKCSLVFPSGFIQWVVSESTYNRIVKQYKK